MQTPETPQPPPFTAINITAARTSPIGSILLGAAALTWFADFLFWKQVPGISFAIFCCAVTGITLSIRRLGLERLVAWVAAGLMLAAACATALEISFTNVAVLLSLLAVIAGECWYESLPAGWARWFEPLVAWGAAPGRWAWLVRETENALPDFTPDARTGDKAARLFQIVAPALCLAVVFGVVFSQGNAVFGNMIARSFVQVVEWFTDFDFSIGRVIFWLVSATLALALVHPRPCPAGQRTWARLPGRFTRGNAVVAIWQSRMVLVVLNALFFSVNTIDVFYLWRKVALPESVTFSAFVHTGVYSLIFAVLLSGAVIMAIFQQDGAVARGRFVKGCALLWIAQDLVLIAGVFRRLQLYVRAYQLSEERIYVGYFLLLVTAGAALLAWHVVRNGELRTLVFRNAVATFALFFVMQFVNTGAWVANYNVARWEAGQSRDLDLQYLSSLGPDAWPALIEAAAHGTDYTEERARNCLRLAAHAEMERPKNWRSWQWRRDSQSGALIEASRKFPPSEPFALPTVGASTDTDGAGER